MKKLALLILLIPVIAWGASANFAGNASFGGVETGGQACTADLGCETFENAYDQSWTDSGWAAKHSFISEGFSSDNSDYHDKGTNIAASDATTWEFSPSNQTAFVEGWVRFQDIAGLDVDAELVRFFYLQTAGDLSAVTLIITYIGTETDVCIQATYYDGGVQTSATTPCGIVADTPYHFGIRYENDGTDRFEWYWSTTSDLGAAQDAQDISTSRDPERIIIGSNTISGTGIAGVIDLEYDSLAVDTTAFTPVE